MPDRFYHPPPLAVGPVTLAGPEAHHLIHVLRGKPGLMVALFDGAGAEFSARVERVERATVQLNAMERREVDREPAIFVVLAVALPKGDRQQWLVEKATELGVARLMPLRTTRGVAQPTVAALARIERAVVEACKQCGRNRLMEIAPPEAWEQFVTVPPADALRLVAHPGGQPISAAMNDSSAAGGGIWLAVGPEGGFTDEEAGQAIAAGWRTIGLGPRLLRTETAAIALAAAVTLGGANPPPAECPRP